MYEHSHFDSDQAILGLMARDIVTREGFPLFYYGQQYLLAIEAWLAAPFVLLIGASVLAIKLPLLVLNLILAAVLVARLVDEEALSPWAALIASLLIAMPPPIPASRMLEASGGHIEPFVWVILLWLLRGRPFWFGVVLAIGVLNREFTIYAPVALAILAASQRRLFTRDLIRRGLVALGAFVLVVAAVLLLIPFAANYFPVVRRPEIAVGDGLAIGSRILPFITGSLATIFGTRADALADYNVRSTLRVGHPWVAIVIGIAAAVLIARLPVLRRASNPRSSLAVYLLLVGLQAVLMPLLIPESGGMLIRYALLSLFLPVGAAAYYLGRETSATPRVAFMTLMVVWAGAGALDHGRLILEYLTRPPANTYRELAIYLERQGHRYGWADYWTAYHVSFLTDRRVVLAPYDVVRIPRDRDLVEAHRESAVRVQREACAEGARLRQWYICRN
jgi:hypothetical protein